MQKLYNFDQNGKRYSEALTKQRRISCETIPQIPSDDNPMLTPDMLSLAILVQVN
jgi:hypothetical protein